jgi:hypothetical protein
MLFWSSNSRGKKQYKNHEKESQKVEVVWEVEEKIESSQKGFMEIGGLIELTYKHFKSLAIAL